MIREKVINNPKLLGVGVAKNLCPKWDQNPIFLIEIGPKPFLGLDLIDPWFSFLISVMLLLCSFS